ncbi:flp pilus-assembly TadE/G-like family protein [Microbispora sp. RL4-1S]|uniref:Flp pilus-assembly TadE/G-like family protein n=1 Tax=Microbispora oryzae TaxID=2806554 RepID=A0A941AS36_9ACTN|nr:flp pilus-assembly TadE/G-like family protein [Microbispora oryzae]
MTLMVAVWAVAMVVVETGAARVARHRAQSAADLGALAAASWALASPEDACGRASAVSEANGARLTSCSVSHGIASVSTGVRFSVALLGSRTATGTARAGPVAADA